jgi:hypothetical protein
LARYGGLRSPWPLAFGPRVGGIARIEGLPQITQTVQINTDLAAEIVIIAGIARIEEQNHVTADHADKR